jgi:uncharacterized membrane protein (DUF485 family)
MTKYLDYLWALFILWVLILYISRLLYLIFKPKWITNPLFQKEQTQLERAGTYISIIAILCYFILRTIGYA